MLEAVIFSLVLQAYKLLQFIFEGNDGNWNHSNSDWQVPLGVGYHEINECGEGEVQSLLNAQERKIALLTKGQKPHLLIL